METKKEETKTEDVKTPEVETENPSVVTLGRNERTSDIRQLATALSKAQSQMELAKKDTDNTFFKTSYADLASVIKAAKKPLSDNDLSITQLMMPHESKVVVLTMLMHKSGQYITSTVALSPVKTDPQGYGSAVTYARRYGYQAIVGLSAEDDDGNKASGKVAPTAAPAPAPIKVEPMSDAQKKKVFNLLDVKGKTRDDLADFVHKAFKITPDKLSLAQANVVIKKLESMPDYEKEPATTEAEDFLNEEVEFSNPTEVVPDSELEAIP